RFHACFFGCEAGRIALKAVRFALDVGALAGGIDAVEKFFAEAFGGGADARDLGEVDAGSDDHRSAPVMVRRPCFTPLVLMRLSAMRRTSAARPFTTSTSRQLS